MKKKKTGFKPIARKVSTKIFYILIIMCIVLSFAIKNAFYRELSVAETQYMTEVIARISAEVNGELNHYIDSAITTAKSKNLQEYLLNLESGISQEYVQQLQDALAAPEEVLPDYSSPVEGEEPLSEADFHLETELPPDDMTDTLPEPEVEPEADIPLPLPGSLSFQEVAGYDSALLEIQEIASVLGDSVLFVVLCSTFQDNFFNSGGLEGDADYTLYNRPFYPAFTTNSTYITDPYVEVLTGKTIITIAEPIFDDNSRTIGILLVQLSLENMGNIVTSSTFGETGASMLMDRDNNIIAYTNPAVVGMNVNDLSYSGDITSQELNNPTGIIEEYNFSGSTRIGGIVTVSDLAGWKLLLAMDASEFKSSISAVTFRFNLGLLIGVIISSIICAASIFKSLAPVKDLQLFMQDLAEGKLTGTLDYHEPDEIGQLAEHMSLTAQSLHGYIQMIDMALQKLGDGDLTRPENINFQGDFTKLETSIETFAQTLSRSLHEIKIYMEQMTLGSEQVSTGAQLLATGSSEQSQSVEGLHNLISGINETILLTAKNSSSVTTDAKHISEDLVLSNDKMQELVVSIQDIRAMSDEVKRIIKSIEDVAFQTNILSLNASVEAARAGTAGRGFAVVADQVRILSASTAEAAEKTTKIINDIADAIETGTELAQNTSRDLQAVVDEVDVFVENISNISLSAQDQADAIAEISNGIDQISQVVVQNSAISQESAASSQELNAQSEQILALVQQYKLAKKQ